MAPKPGHWLSYGDRQRDKGGMQMQSPGSQKKTQRKMARQKMVEKRKRSVEQMAT